MASLNDQLSRLVYSTQAGDICPACRQAKNECCCQENSDQERIASLDGIIRIRRETSGRKGKGVTTVSGVPLAEAELKKLLKQLKQHCGTGGALKDGVIEIQGDHRDTIKGLLEKLKYKVKLAGG
ncbi:translation initiation factor Sui1 [Neptunomonas antarctica]|uniref:Translation initiation factor 1 (eIF-1/SUI1) n=1 Tax=Neptunomonas antarctica TaxID=619304 RepID=A0A1N7M6Z3_9GAMM|nr:translation initiation factor Sui1 [Neptunomonas antarctica]SIS81741.1 translation initiation factor 1 (eIF-1/SUI1) [Neptunomonas antarctica]